ncbi:MAG: hypothetical protein ACOYNL_00800 [Rickettsiales bacterium]
MTKAPWKKPAQKGVGNIKMTEEQKAQARARAEKAGRRYPNLVDNMAVLKEAKAKTEMP